MATYSEDYFVNRNFQLIENNLQVYTYDQKLSFAEKIKKTFERMTDRKKMFMTDEEYDELIIRLCTESIRTAAQLCIINGGVLRLERRELLQEICNLVDTNRIYHNRQIIIAEVEFAGGVIPLFQK